VTSRPDGADRAPDSARRALDGFYGAPPDDDAEQLYERALCGYVSTAPDGTIVKVNQTFLDLTGYDRADLVGRRRFVELLTAGGRIYHETHYAPMLQMHGEVHEIAMEVVRVDESRLPVLVNSVLVRDPEGNPTTVRTAVFDATHRREYERELLRAKESAEAAEARATALARTLQQTLIPPSAPVVPDLEVAAAYRPAGSGVEVGGDFYDVFQIGSGDWVVAVGDVCGKGVEAAVVTALVRYTLRAACVQHDEPSGALAVLNEVLLQHETDRFCTVGLVRLRREADGWGAVAASAGHPLPLVRRADGSVSPAGQPGTLIGVLPVATATDVHVSLGPGDALLLVTDGVTEARHGDSFLGDARLAALLRAAAPTADAMVTEVLDDVLAFQGGSPRDDIALVAVRVPS
jgi:phosphoserine phosphatase RsbU/P